MTSAFPLVRNPDALATQAFDVAVVGGGIYGAWIAADAAQRGLKVALVEKQDWGAGTSSASSKLIHGGLRYLEHYEFALVRHALGERRVLSRIAPHLVHPVNFLVPVWRGARVGRLQLLAGLTLYDLLATGKQPVPRFKSFARAPLLKAHPFLRADGLRGGLRYGDCQEDDARMTMMVVAAAQSVGAVCANRVTAESFVMQAGRAVGIAVHDRIADRRFPLRAELVINAGGPWSRKLLEDGDASGPPAAVRLVKGVHLVLPGIPGCYDAFLLTAPQDGRVFFVIPWYGRTLVGTTESAVNDPAEALVTAAERAYLLDAVAALMPGLGWSAADVIAEFAGVRSLQADDAASLSAVTREFALLEPRPGVLWPVGGKYTTARCDSEEVVDRALALLGRPATASRSSRTMLPGAPTEIAGQGDFSGWQSEALTALAARGVDEESARWLTLRHGTGISRIYELIANEPGLAARLHPRAPFLRAEAVLAIRDEMALDADDVLRRRMPLQLLVDDADGGLSAARRYVENLLADAPSGASAPSAAR